MTTDTLLSANAEFTGKSVTISGSDLVAGHEIKFGVGAISADGAKSEGWTFVTIIVVEGNTVPQIQTKEASDVTTTSAVLHGSVINNGGAEVTEWGFYWSTNALDFPIENGYSSNDPITVGVDATHTLNNLTPNTKYYYYFYAVNSKGESVRDVKEFTTLEEAVVVAPTVETLLYTNLDKTAVTLNGCVTDNGGAEIVEWGFGLNTSFDFPKSCFYTSTDPLAVGETATYDATGLKAGTKYYYCFYAKNSAGETVAAYKEFTTLPEDIPVPSMTFTMDAQTVEKNKEVTFILYVDNCTKVELVADSTHKVMFDLATDSRVSKVSDTEYKLVYAFNQAGDRTVQFIPYNGDVAGSPTAVQTLKVTEPTPTSLDTPVLTSGSSMTIKVMESATIDWNMVNGAERYALIVYDQNWKPLRTENGYPVAELTDANTTAYTYTFEVCGMYYVQLYAQAGIVNGAGTVQSDAVTVTINVDHEWISSGTSIDGSGEWKVCTKNRDTYCCYQASVKYYKKCAICGTLSDKSLYDVVSYSEDNASKSSHSYREVSRDETYRSYDEVEHIMVTTINKKCSGCGKTTSETFESEYRAAHVYDSDYICLAKGCGYKLSQNSVITQDQLQESTGTYNPGLAEELANIAREAYSSDPETGKYLESTTLAQNGFKNITSVDVSLYDSKFFESNYVTDVFDVEATVAIKEEASNSIIAVSFQGTSETTDWLVDAMASAQLAGIHDGFNAQIIEFLKATDSIYFDTADGKKTMRELINEAKSGNGSISFVITGHSMGAADAQVFTYYLLNAGVPASAITTYTFASPLPFLKEYIDPEMYEGATIYNIINTDIVPMVGVAKDTPMDSSVTDTLTEVLRVVDDVRSGKREVSDALIYMINEVQGISYLSEMFMMSLENILAENAGHSNVAQNIGENIYFSTDISSVDALRDGFNYLEGLTTDTRDKVVLRLLLYPVLNPALYKGYTEDWVSAMKDDLMAELGSNGVEVVMEMYDAIYYNHKPTTYIDHAKTAK